MNGWIQSAHFQAFPQSTPSAKIAWIAEDLEQANTQQ